jgi:cellulose synthase/poly-beta-1,6-N-acetylglucosamine synthase-like glycosyltransferase
MSIATSATSACLWFVLLFIFRGSLWDFTTTISIATVAASATSANLWFVLLFIFRYLRLVVHIISFYFLYKPWPVPPNPKIKPSDVTVIIPTIDPENEGFLECIQTVLTNAPAAIIIATVPAKFKLVKKVVKPFRKSWPATKISINVTAVANKRRQVCGAVPMIRTAITMLVDDHVYWMSPDFLKSAIAPFEDPNVGGVGTKKRVRRAGWGWSLPSVVNFLGCVYLERHNFEITATNAIDGGVFVLSGRTAGYRTSMLQDPDFLRGFAYETFFYGKFGPLNPDDDNFICRWAVKKGWKLAIQNSQTATIETDLGVNGPGKWLSQCLRWVRTTWRSNPRSLFADRVVWTEQPWCTYAVHISSLFNFALFYDMALMITLQHTTYGHSKLAIWSMAAFIFASKMVKLLPHFWRCPADILLIPAYIGFAYYHSLIKLYALFTFWDCAWGGRNLAAVDADAQQGDDEGFKSSDDEDDTELRSESTYARQLQWEFSDYLAAQPAISSGASFVNNGTTVPAARHHKRQAQTASPYSSFR